LSRSFKIHGSAPVHFDEVSGTEPSRLQGERGPYMRVGQKHHPPVPANLSNGPRELMKVQFILQILESDRLIAKKMKNVP